MTWTNGRLMMSYAKDGNTVTFTYDSAGNRLSKTVNGVTTTYTYVGGRLYGQQTGADKLVFLYDANGSVYGFTYNGVSYYYHRNIQGDVLGIYDSTGTEIVTYSYDAWGLPTGMTDTSTNGIGTINPIRYRGYLYDAELGFYWLTTRFYDPEIGRFINADGMIAGISDSVLGYNLYAYCFDNPVNLQDSTGQWPSWGTIFKAVTVVAVAVAVVAAVAVTVSTFGAGSAAGVAVVTAAVTVAARATEVAVLQAKKSTTPSNNSNGETNGSVDGNSAKKTDNQVVTDVVESLYDNGAKIVGITPYTKAASIGANYYLDKQLAEIFEEQITLRSTLSGTTGKVIPYTFAAYAWFNTVVSIFSDDPEQRAEQRGYTLK